MFQSSITKGNHKCALKCSSHVNLCALIFMSVTQCVLTCVLEKEARVWESHNTLNNKWHGLYFFPNCKVNGYTSAFWSHAVSEKPDRLQIITVKAPMSRPCHMETPLNHFLLLNDTGYHIVPLCVPIKGFEVNLELLFPCLQAASPHRHSATNPSLNCFTCIQLDKNLLGDDTWETRCQPF